MISQFQAYQSVYYKGGGKVMTVTCAPTAVGTRTATLHLTTNDPLQSQVTYPLNCTGQEAIGTVYSSTPAVAKVGAVWTE
ncbi:MAG: hypothetical protein R3E08_07775 [Thiotrichaceae bacterium]